MRAVRFLLLLGVVVAAIDADSVGAAFISPTSYSMPNGSGQASAGTFNYWDLNYTGSGLTSTDGAPLTGGLGDLTDGVIATDIWFNVENVAGTGPYVGWKNVDPTIVFDFAAVSTFDVVNVYLDDSGFGGVSFPLRIYVNGVEFDVSGPASGTPRVASLNLGGLVTDQLSIMLVRNNEWVFASEFTFEGQVSAVPEPASITLLGLGSLGLIGFARRRRQTA